MDSHRHAIDDRVMWAHIRHRRLSHRHASVPTVAYRTAFNNHYRYFGETPPPGCKEGAEVLESLERVRIEQERSRGQ